MNDHTPRPTPASGPAVLPDEDELIELLARALVADLKARPNSVRVKTAGVLTVGSPSGPDRDRQPGLVRQAGSHHEDPADG